MAKFEKTIRDFVCLREGKAVLSVLFDFSKFPPPARCDPVQFAGGVSTHVLGRAFEDVLHLMLHRKKPKMMTVDCARCLRYAAKQVAGYAKSGALSDLMLNRILQIAIESQAGFVAFGGPIRLRPNKDMREALRLLHARADSLRWELGERFRYVTIQGVVLDLLIDKTAIEVKTVKDFAHHSDHVAQLLGYSLMAALPVNRRENVVIERIGIYYSRHGELALQDLANMRRFAKKDLPVIAEMFFEQFIRWRVDHDYDGFSAARRSVLLKNELNRVRRIFKQWKNDDDPQKISPLFPLHLGTNIGLYCR